MKQYSSPEKEVKRARHGTARCVYSVLAHAQCRGLVVPRQPPAGERVHGNTLYIVRGSGSEDAIVFCGGGSRLLPVARGGMELIQPLFARNGDDP